MDETLWCPANPNSDVSFIKRATAPTGKLFDEAYNKIQLPGLKVGDSAEINDTISVSANGCVSNIYNKGKNATVKVHGDLEGTGFFVTEDGMIATAAHLVPEPGNTVLVDDGDGNRFAARVREEDRANDVAILKVIDNRQNPTPFKPLELRDEPLRPQEPVAAFGHPKSWDKVYISPGTNDGNLTPYERSSTKDWQQANQLTAIRNHVELGNSGGPLVDNTGRAVGVVVGRYTNRSDMSLVIPVPAIKSALSKAYLSLGLEEGWRSNSGRTQLAEPDSTYPSTEDNNENYYAKRDLTASIGTASATLNTALSTWGNNAKTLLNVGIAITKVPQFSLPIRVKTY
jgi:Trypsin-like serine proteases, typically periplasmic, contain C-terminal PDZ domain